MGSKPFYGAATDLPLLHHGERLAAVGILMGGVFFFLTRAGMAGKGTGFGGGRYLGMLVLRIPVLIVGLVGAVMIFVAVLP